MVSVYASTTTFSVKQAGFTLLEMVLVVAMISILAAFSVPVYGNLFTRNDLDDAKMILIQSVRRAELLAQAEDGATANTPSPNWGVRIQSGSIIIFKGTSYATRDTTEDEIYPINNTVNVSTTDVLFSPLTGFPTPAASTNIVLSTSGNDSRTVSINTKGMVDY